MDKKLIDKDIKFKLFSQKNGFWTKAVLENNPSIIIIGIAFDRKQCLDAAWNTALAFQQDGSASSCIVKGYDLQGNAAAPDQQASGTDIADAIKLTMQKCEVRIEPWTPCTIDCMIGVVDMSFRKAVVSANGSNFLPVATV